jgi:hypothetical protein
MITSILNVADVGSNATEPHTANTVQFAGDLALGPELGDLSIISKYMKGKYNVKISC